MNKETTKKILNLLSLSGGYAHMKDFKNASIRTDAIKELKNKGILDKIKPGLYRPANLEYPNGVSLSFVDISKAIPSGVICLISALAHYNLTTFNPKKVDVAIPNNKNAPKMNIPVEIFYFRDRFFNAGITNIKTKYGDVKIYSREKTICDMFRYRNKFGEDIALEGLKSYLEYKYADLNELKEYAEICHVKLVMMPYLKALVG